MTKGSWVVAAVLAFFSAGCESGGKAGDEGGTAGQSFALTACEDGSVCDTSFECAAFPCPADCAADASGACDACQVGTICLPRPPADCDPEACGAGMVCERSCSGGCDLANGWCDGVACAITCVPVVVDPAPTPDQGCISDFTDACLPPNYPVAARLDEVCAAQGMQLTDTWVAAECWPGAVQYAWTCCRYDGIDPNEPRCYPECDPTGQCTDVCCDPMTGECWGGEPQEPTCYQDCDPDGQCRETCCDPMTGECWGNDPGQPACETSCDEDGFCYEKCCDWTTGECWGTDPNQPPTEVCVQGGFDLCLPEGVDVTEHALADCSSQNLELRDIQMAGQCDDGSFWYTWTCCGGATTEPPSTPICEKTCDATDPNGACTEVCCDPVTGACWENGPNEPQPPECRTECPPNDACIETCCDASGCWPVPDKGAACKEDADCPEGQACVVTGPCISADGVPMGCPGVCQ